MNTSLRIAVADSEPSMRQFLYRTLTHEGHRVVIVAENGQQLVDQCVECRPDLVITEIEMPELDGLAAIREICRTGPLPSIIISSDNKRETLLRASRELVFAFLIKPIKMDDLQPAIWLSMLRYCELCALWQRLALTV